jgi:hypothetical protein
MQGDIDNHAVGCCIDSGKDIVRIAEPIEVAECEVAARVDNSKENFGTGVNMGSFPVFHPSFEESVRVISPRVEHGHLRRRTEGGRHAPELSAGSITSTWSNK